MPRDRRVKAARAQSVSFDPEARPDAMVGFPRLLRDWRQKRRLSQLDLALARASPNAMSVSSNPVGPTQPEHDPQLSGRRSTFRYVTATPG